VNDPNYVAAPRGIHLSPMKKLFAAVRTFNTLLPALALTINDGVRAPTPTAIQWHATRTKGAAGDAAGLPFCSIVALGFLLRHHVAGGIGREAA